MNLPGKKHAVAMLIALTMMATLLMGCSFNKTVGEVVPQESTVSESQFVGYRVPPVEEVCVVENEVYAAQASEEVEEVPTLDRTKPIYEVYKNGYAVSVPTELQWYIRDMCEKYNFPEKPIYGMILCESTFNPSVSNGGCYGLAQINKFWIRGANITHFTDDYRSRNLLDPYDNILTMFEMWTYCRDTYGLNPYNQSDMLKILYWHNTGRDPRHVTKWAYATRAFGFANELVQLQGE